MLYIIGGMFSLVEGDAMHYVNKAYLVLRMQMTKIYCILWLEPIQSIVTSAPPVCFQKFY
jgi:hypothetical protein